MPANIGSLEADFRRTTYRRHDAFPYRESAETMPGLLVTVSGKVRQQSQQADENVVHVQINIQRC